MIKSYGRGTRGFRESYEYNDDGELGAKVTVPSSCAPYGPEERKETFIRSEGKIRIGVSKCGVTTYKYDSSGRLTKSHKRVTSQRGRPARSTSQRRKSEIITTYEYDKQGNLVKVARKTVIKAPWKGDSVTKESVSTSTYDFSCWEEGRDSARETGSKE